MPETYWLLINRVLTQGRMSNSYKPALLRALADYGASGRNELRVSWEWLAERFVIYYWPLAIRHRVRQATDPVKEPVVVRLIKELEVKSTMTADQFRQRDANQFENLIERLVQPGTTCCLDQVVPRFHNLRSDPPALLYDQHDGEIAIRAEALTFLQHHHETLRLLAIGRWVKFTEKFSVAPRLWEKIEGRSKRGSLSRFRNGLKAIGMAEDCFYCEIPLQDQWDVDHFLPWSYVLDDQMWNLVPACKSCNSHKSDAVPVKWIRKLEIRNAEQVIQSYFKDWASEDLVQHLAIMCRAATSEGFPEWSEKIS